MKYEVAIRGVIVVEASCEDEAEEIASAGVHDGVVRLKFDACSLEDEPARQQNGGAE